MAKRSKPQVWKSDHYFSDLDSSIPQRERHWPELSAKLKVDIGSLFDEHVAQKAQLTYPYGASGIRGGYTASMSEIADNHVEYLKKQGLATARAKQEAAVARAVEEWMHPPDATTESDSDPPEQPSPETPSDRFLISISPRGAEIEGYPGYDPGNYVLINVYERETDGSFRLWQLRSYDTNADLPKLQADLAEMAGARTTNLPTAHKQHLELPIIGRLIALPETASLDEITRLIYQRKDSWVVNVDTDLPHLDEAAYVQNRDALVQFCVAAFHTLLSEQENPALLANLGDALLELSTEHLAKWVHDHATNYAQGAEKTTYSINIPQLQQAFMLKKRTLTGENLSAEEHQTLNSLLNSTALPIGSPLNRLMSMAHCVTGSPASLLNQPNLLQAVQLNQLSHAQLVKLVGSERAQKWHLGRCQRCGAPGVMVGECSWCYACEIGFSDNAGAGIDPVNARIDQSLSGADRAEAQALYEALRDAIIKPSISPQNLLDGDYLQATPERSDPWVEFVWQRLSQSSNPLHDLRQISAKLGNPEHKHTKAGVIFPQQLRQAA